MYLPTSPQPGTDRASSRLMNRLIPFFPFPDTSMSICLSPSLCFSMLCLSLFFLPSISFHLTPPVSSPSRIMRNPMIVWVCFWELFCLINCQRQSTSPEKAYEFIFLAELCLCLYPHLYLSISTSFSVATSLCLSESAAPLFLSPCFLVCMSLLISLLLSLALCVCVSPQEG